MSKQHPLKNGTYVIQFTENERSKNKKLFEGSLRVFRQDDIISISIDTYRVEKEFSDRTTLSNRIPLFNLTEYNSYLRCSSFEENQEIDVLEFEEFKFINGEFTKEVNKYRTEVKKEGQEEGVYSGRLTRIKDGAEWDFDLFYQTDFYRSIEIEVRNLAGYQINDNGELDDLIKRLEEQLEYLGIQSKINLGEELSQINTISTKTDLLALLCDAKKNRKIEINKTWKYYFLVVNNIQRGKKPRSVPGFMFTRSARQDRFQRVCKEEKNLNILAREGAAVAANWVFDCSKEINEERTSHGKLLKTIPKAYERTFYHELGHMLGLDHEDEYETIMRPTCKLAKDMDIRFPDKIKFTFTYENQFKIKHLPDPYIRPRMIDFDEFDGIVLAEEIQIKL